MRRETLDSSGEDVRRETEDEGVIEGWGETTASRNCSDAAIAPLATAQRTRLSGLSLATNVVTVTTDVRGNETVTMATLDPVSQSSYEITLAPGILNVATNWYTDGVIGVAGTNVIEPKFDSRNRHGCATY